jgi:replication factor C small subunit
MNNKKHKLWTEVYRPQTIEEYVFHDTEQEQKFREMIHDQTIPQLLLSGVQGSGKTTLAQILIRELHIDDIDVLVINASDENSVDIMRDKIKSFVSTFAMSTFKIVLLEEADYLTANAQAILRRLTEEYSDTSRFILTCNYDNKIIPALKSRCQHFRFHKPDRDAVLLYVGTVLHKENIKCTLELLDSYVSLGYPDIRKVINLLQQNTINGKLLPITQAETSDYKFKLLDLLEQGNWIEIRNLTCSQVSAEEWDDVYEFLYTNLSKVPKFSKKETWESGIVIIADHLDKHGRSTLPQINAAAMFIKLEQL